jgi:hypothetical protein
MVQNPLSGIETGGLGKDFGATGDFGAFSSMA